MRILTEPLWFNVEVKAFLRQRFDLGSKPIETEREKLRTLTYGPRTNYNRDGSSLRVQELQRVSWNEMLQSEQRNSHLILVFIAQEMLQEFAKCQGSLGGVYKCFGTCQGQEKGGKTRTRWQNGGLSCQLQLARSCWKRHAVAPREGTICPGATREGHHFSKFLNFGPQTSQTSIF